VLARGVHARVIAAVAALLVLAALCAAPPASAAPAAPTGLTPGIGDTVDATPVLSWDRVPDATSYEVDISAAADFSTKLVSTVTTVNRRVTPTIQLPMSELYWRVRAKNTTGASDWTTATFSRSRLAGPVLRAPSNGELLDQPSEPVVFAWDPVPGAIGYTIEVDRGPDVDWINTITGTTRTTTATPIAIASGDWAWRVIATLASGQLTFPSVSRTFTLGDLDPVTVTSPADGQDLEDVVLDWDPVPGALRYEVRVSTDDEFATTNIVDARSVKGTRYSPVTTYDVDDYWWQVRAIDPLAVAVPWSDVPIHSFTRTWDPLPTTPGRGVDPNPQPDLDGAPRLVYPADTLAPAVTGDMYFQWTPVRHATNYRLDVGTDPNFSPTTFKSCFTPHTTFTPERVSAGQCLPGLNTSLYWRVKALDEPKGVQGYYSPIRKFRYSRQYVTLASPADRAEVAVPTLSWEPVAGAEKYFVHVLSRSGEQFSAVTHSTSWTVEEHLDPADGPFEWGVEAVGNDGVTTPATIIGSTRLFTLEGTVPDTAAGPLTPLAQGAAPTSRFPALTWEPMAGAATYRLWVGTAGTNTYNQVVGDFSYPAATDTSSTSIGGGDYRWFVQAFDVDGNLIGTGPRTGAFTVLELAPVAGQQVALHGTSLDSGSTCTYSLLDTPARICPTTAGTPVLDWQPQPDIAFYMVYVSRDRNFQNMVYGSYSDPGTLPTTTNTRWTRTATLPESQAGTAYYWFIRPCKAVKVCAPDPLQANHAFEKRSPQVITDPVLETSNDITFSWRDYLATNQVAAPHLVTGERSGQEARTYQVQVSLTIGFDRVVDDIEVDQTTYTAFSRLYPEGTLYWRVRAYDGDDRALPWSDTRVFVKGSPRPSAIAPIGTLTTTDALRWTASPFAVSYDVQVYKQGDTTASPVNRVIDDNVMVASYAPLIPLPAGNDYAWRVRGVDDSGNPGGWSDWATYRIEGAAPILDLPVAAGTLPTADGLYTWHAVTGAATYRFERRELTGAVKETVSTAALAWAPTAKIPAGAWQWRVTALDTGGTAIASSAWRSVTVKAGPSATSTPVVTGSGSVGELLHGSNPAWDVPDVVATYQWLRNGAAIAGATGVDYEVVTADVGKSISLRVTGNVAGYDPATAVSNAVTGVLGATTSAVTPPTIDGTGQVGTTLNATLPEWDQTDITTTYRWLRDGVIASSGTLSYTVRDSDLGKTISFQVTGKKTGYGDAVVTTPGVLVTAAGAPSPSVPPSITGQPKVGQRLGVQTGTWGSGFRYTVQWLRDGNPLPGATATTYTPVAADATHALSVQVTAARTGYASGTATTAPVVVPKMTSATTFSLPATKVKAKAGKGKIKATVTVTVSGWPTPSGQVRVLDGKRVIAKAKLKKGGMVTVKLKKLRKGKHKLRATYDGTAAAAKSTSTRLVLKVF
jgi:large repetitive protein